jgi:hypothetical protein
MLVADARLRPLRHDGAIGAPRVESGIRSDKTLRISKNRGANMRKTSMRKASMRKTTTILLLLALGSCGQGAATPGASAPPQPSCNGGDYYFTASPLGKGYPHAVPLCK